MSKINKPTGKMDDPATITLRADAIIQWWHAIRLQQRASTRKTRKIKRLKLTIKELEKLADDLYDALEVSHTLFIEAFDQSIPCAPNSPIKKEIAALEAYENFVTARRGVKIIPP